MWRVLAAMLFVAPLTGQAGSPLAAQALAQAQATTPASTLAAERLAEQSFALFLESPVKRDKALADLVASGRADAAPILILAIRFAPRAFGVKLVAAL